LARERQLAERLMSELAITQKLLEDLQASRAREAQCVWSSWAKHTALGSFGFSPVRGGDATPEAGVMLPLLDSVGRKISQLEEAVRSRLEEDDRALAYAVADHMVMCFRSRDPNIFLEPVVQGPIEGCAEAAREDVKDPTRVVAERFELKPKDA
jgi:hypothetical protein